ncbi:3-hydroxybutyrate oligomer hydrolase family protein [Burkholderia vietnamiensis]|uniref:3-hydroxybutyrate oligomer hydrolase family protein n=1 Tax=Burkholderia vietnamiensis TaxID=60552 RepID=UPI000D78C056|nr:3-hydroxybutyrate oligomer hydrolase family protein [Burkholderia vietnamiensis]GBH27293.1 D-(-)-3-hydroxybutyrate oligomer hydrolase [Burkholderia vietnamiensis]
MDAHGWGSRILVGAALAALTMLGAGNGDETAGRNQLPVFVSGPVRTTAYDGASDDLLTAGLGKTGLASAAAPAFADPSRPTAAELRRVAIWSNYRALVDMSANGGYGRFWGPNADLDGNDTLGEGKIAGTEYLADADDGSGRKNVTLLVQVPASFDPAQPCIVAATSSGSGGVYGAISAAGEWGLKRGCAVAYNDKGGGNGAQELGSNTVTLIDGTLANAVLAGSASLFTANLTSGDLAAFNSRFPNRYAFKHAHSQQNPEHDWGRATLQSVEFAYWALNQQFAPLVDGSHRGVRYRAGDIPTIAASVSNGGGAAPAAAEQATRRWITAVGVGEPQINVRMAPNAVGRESGRPVPSFGRPLADYATLANLLEPCAAASASLAGEPYLSALPLAPTQSIRTPRCPTPAAAGLVSGAETQSQAAAALAQLHAAGYLADSDLLQASMWDSQAIPAIAVTYANAYTRSSVTDNLGNFSFATTNAATGAVAAPAASPMPAVFGLGNGVPPTAGINLVFNTGAGVDHRLATPDASFAGALCLRQLWTNGMLDMPANVEAVRVNANLQGKPAIIVQGRSDALVPVNHASRAYVAQNSISEGGRSQLVFYEVTNGQHFDAFLPVAGFDTRFVPVHYYNVQALNLMWRHLKSGAPLPPSQVIRTVPRGGTPGAAPALTSANLPPLSTAPGANAIAAGAGAIDVPP